MANAVSMVYGRGTKGDVGGGGNTKPSEGGCTIENEIDNSSASAPPALPPVCQSRRGVIGDAECANCRRSATRIYRAGNPSRRTRVRMKAHSDGTIVKAISIVTTTSLRNVVLVTRRARSESKLYFHINSASSVELGKFNGNEEP